MLHFKPTTDWGKVSLHMTQHLKKRKRNKTRSKKLQASFNHLTSHCVGHIPTMMVNQITAEKIHMGPITNSEDLVLVSGVGFGQARAFYSELLFLKLHLFTLRNVDIWTETAEIWPNASLLQAQRMGAFSATTGRRNLLSTRSESLFAVSLDIIKSKKKSIHPISGPEREKHLGFPGWWGGLCNASVATRPGKHSQQLRGHQYFIWHCVWGAFRGSKHLQFLGSDMNENKHMPRQTQGDWWDGWIFFLILWYQIKSFEGAEKPQRSSKCYFFSKGEQMTFLHHVAVIIKQLHPHRSAVSVARVLSSTGGCLFRDHYHIKQF